MRYLGRGCMTEFVGRQFGNYRLTRLIGSGGFADVYEGEHGCLDTHSAIKVLKTRLVDEEQEHFLQEARTIARLIHHRHCIRALVVVKRPVYRVWW